MHVMIDIETMGLGATGALVEIGAMAFELRSGGKVLNNKAYSQAVLLAPGSGSIDHGTVAFWLEESTRHPGMALKMKDDPVPLVDALNGLAAWPTEVLKIEGGWDAVEGVWAKGPSFDLANLAHKYSLYGVPTPWHYRKERDVRTFMALQGVNSSDIQIDSQGFKPHDGADDCLWQITEMQEALRIRGSAARH